MPRHVQVTDGLSALYDFHRGNQPPAEANDGDIWFRPSPAAWFTYNSSLEEWIEFGGGGGGGGGGAPSLSPDSLLYIADEKAAGTNGGDAVANQWQRRDLNTVHVDNVAGAALADDEVTLPAGRYWMTWRVPHYRVHHHVSRLYNVTADEVVGYGSREYSADAATTSGNSHGAAFVEFSEETVIRLEQRVNNSNTGNGLGVGNFDLDGAPQTFSELMAWRIEPGGGGGSGGGLLAHVYDYEATGYSTSSTSFEDVDATRLAVTFAAPASGRVVVVLTAYADFSSGSGGDQHLWNLREDGADLPETFATISRRDASFRGHRLTHRVVLDVDPGEHTITWGWRTDGGTIRIFGGPDDVPQGPCVMEVWAA
jgi:hypothetical protein